MSRLIVAVLKGLSLHKFSLIFVKNTQGMFCLPFGTYEILVFQQKMRQNFGCFWSYILLTWLTDQKTLDNWDFE